jgi:hypothetical protein
MACSILVRQLKSELLHQATSKLVNAWFMLLKYIILYLNGEKTHAWT